MKKQYIMPVTEWVAVELDGQLLVDSLNKVGVSADKDAVDAFDAEVKGGSSSIWDDDWDR